jgi:malonyl CoA-acyl carrier protein transacylase
MTGTKEKIAFCFPGQLQERPRLEDSSLKEDPFFRECAERASHRSEFDLLRFSFRREEEQNPSLEPLKLQMATYLLSMVHYYRLQAAGWIPAILAEHSMGIYAALAASGAITFEEGLFITESIGRLLRREGASCPGAMASIIGLSLDQVQEVCSKLDGYQLSIANYNGSMQYVLSGEAEGVEKAIAFALRRGAISAARLPFDTALHCSSLLSLRGKISSLLEEIKIQVPRVPILNHWTIRPLRKEEIKDFLSEEIGRPVYWVRCVERLIGEGVTEFIEVGHEASLTKLIRWINRDVEARTAGDRLGQRS